MKFNFSSLLKYLLSLALAVGLFWYLYRNQNMQQMLDSFVSADYRWIGLSFVVYMLSHLSRGWRWSLMLQGAGYRAGVLGPFLAVMVGYLANFVLPRMGEVSRCAILKKTNDIPVNISFGAVIAERVVDMLMLLLISAVTVLIEFDRLSQLLTDLQQRSSAGMASKLYLLLLLAGLGVAGLLLLYLLRNRLKKLPLYQKITTFLQGIKEGLLSIAKLSTGQQLAFVLHSVLIWVCYYLTSYLLFFATEATSDLGMACALSVLVMSGLSIAVPVQGGVGVYHLFVGATLMAYGLPKDTSTVFAFMMHSTQMVVMIVTGLISLVLSMVLSRNK